MTLGPVLGPLAQGCGCTLSKEGTGQGELGHLRCQWLGAGAPAPSRSWFSVSKIGLMITNPPPTSGLWRGFCKRMILCIEMSQQVSSLWRKGLIYYYQLIEQKFHLSPLLPLQRCVNRATLPRRDEGSAQPSSGHCWGPGEARWVSPELRGDAGTGSRAGTSGPNATAETYRLSNKSKVPRLGCECWGGGSPAGDGGELLPSCLFFRFIIITCSL